MAKAIATVFLAALVALFVHIVLGIAITVMSAALVIPY